MGNHLRENLTLLRKSRGLNQAEAATALGFKRSTYSNYESGHTEPNIEALLKISSFFGISVGDLLINKLESVPLTDKEENPKNVPPTVPPSVPLKEKNTVKPEDFHHIEEYEPPVKRVPRGAMPKVITINSQGEENAVYVPVKARAGYLVGYGDPQFIEKLPAYNLPGLRNGTYRIFEVDGLSMFNTLQDKDKVIARWVQPSEIRDDRIHVLITKNDGILIKRVLNRLSEGKLVCKSDNNHRGEYPPIVLDASEVLEAWYVVERWTRMLPSPGEIYKRIVDLEADMAIIKQKLLRGEN